MKIKQYRNEDLLKWNKVYLLSDEIHIWIIQWKEISEFLSEYFYTMNNREREKISEYKFNEDKMRCVAGKIVTRLLLSQYLGVENAEIQICKEEYGKPYHQKIDGKKSVSFSISHSGDIVLVGFSYYSNLGVDIEHIISFPEYKDIARDFFTKEEALDVERCMKLSVFYRYWTAKEAYLKAIGIGLTCGMDFFSVNDGCIKEDGRINRNWRLFPIEINQEYVACVAVQIR